MNSLHIRNLDDIAISNRGYKINPPKKRHIYQQRMQSLYGSRKFLLETKPSGKQGMVIITLFEDKKQEWQSLGKRIINNNPVSIHEAIRFLERRKAKCKLYYVLLISTDGEYL